MSNQDMKKQLKALKGDLVSAVSLVGDREDQQDCVGMWTSESACLMAVADGAGGHADGARASALAVSVLETVWKERLPELLASPEDVIRGALLEAHQSIIDETGSGNAVQSGKAAVVVLLVLPGEYVAAHVGDCRMYHFSRGTLVSQTVDDSILQVLIDSGRVAPFEAYHHPDQSKLIQALGASRKITPHVERGEWQAGDAFILCCDGFWQELHTGEIAAISLASPEKALQELEKYASLAVQRTNGDSDNVTAVSYFSHPPGVFTRFMNMFTIRQ